MLRKTNRDERSERKARLQHAIEQLESGNAPVPSNHEAYVGDGPYIKIAIEFLRYFVEVAGLQSHHRVLDIGCGVGRMACGLNYYLGQETAQYIGFDPMPDAIRWCQETYADRPGFDFVWADTYNELYNPGGSIPAADYVFPCRSQSIDFALATSVFTHLYEDDVNAYLKETARVLRPQGRMLATAYVYEGDRPPTDTTRLVFNQQAGPAGLRWHMQDVPPLAAVCYSEDYFSEMVVSAFGRRPTIRKGRWQGGGPWFQDLVII